MSHKAPHVARCGPGDMLVVGLPQPRIRPTCWEGGAVLWMCGDGRLGLRHLAWGATPAQAYANWRERFLACASWDVARMLDAAAAP